MLDQEKEFKGYLSLARQERIRLRELDLDLDKIEKKLIVELNNLQKSKSEPQQTKQNLEDKMEIGEYVKKSSAFLRAEDVKASKSPKFIITDEATLMKNNFEQEVLRIPGEIDGKEFLFDTKVTNARVIAMTLGTDTKSWKGSVLNLETYKTKTSDNKMVEAINVAGVVPSKVVVEKI